MKMQLHTTYSYIIILDAASLSLSLSRPTPRYPKTKPDPIATIKMKRTSKAKREQCHGPKSHSPSPRAALPLTVAGTTLPVGVPVTLEFRDAAAQ